MTKEEKIYIYIYICREREKEREDKRVWARGEEEGGRVGSGSVGGGTGRVGLRVKKGKEEVKTKLKGKIFIQHQTTASI